LDSIARRKHAACLKMDTQGKCLDVTPLRQRRFLILRPLNNRFRFGMVSEPCLIRSQIGLLVMSIISTLFHMPMSWPKGRLVIDSVAEQDAHVTIVPLVYSVSEKMMCHVPFQNVRANILLPRYEPMRKSLGAYIICHTST
jgi:hypothetical protein